jgi:hypothetical protein
MYFVHPATSECFFFCLLLTVVLGATTFEHLRTIDNTKHLTFQTACKTLGLLKNDTKWDTCMREACIDQDTKRLRNLFVTFLLFCSPLNLKVLWERYRDDMSHDMRHRRITNGGTTEDAYNDTPLLLEAKLALTNKGLHDFPEMSLILPPGGCFRGWFLTMSASGVQKLSSSNHFSDLLVFGFVASSAHFDSHERHEIAC